jgi:hypothetical protein
LVIEGLADVELQDFLGLLEGLNHVKVLDASIVYDVGLLLLHFPVLLPH